MTRRTTTTRPPPWAASPTRRRCSRGAARSRSERPGTITYSFTINSTGGDGKLRNAVVSSSSGGSCFAATLGPDCQLDSLAIHDPLASTGVSIALASVVGGPAARTRRNPGGDRSAPLGSSACGSTGREAFDRGGTPGRAACRRARPRRRMRAARPGCRSRFRVTAARCVRATAWSTRRRCGTVEPTRSRVVS